MLAHPEPTIKLLPPPVQESANFPDIEDGEITSEFLKSYLVNNDFNPPTLVCMVEIGQMPGIVKNGAQ